MRCRAILVFLRMLFWMHLPECLGLTHWKKLGWKHKERWNCRRQLLYQHNVFFAWMFWVVQVQPTIENHQCFAFTELFDFWFCLTQFLQSSHAEFHIREGNNCSACEGCNNTTTNNHKSSGSTHYGVIQYKPTGKDLALINKSQR